MNEISRKPAHTVTELASAHQHRKKRSAIEEPQVEGGRGQARLGFSQRGVVRVIPALCGCYAGFILLLSCCYPAAILLLSCCYSCCLYSSFILLLCRFGFVYAALFPCFMQAANHRQIFSGTKTSCCVIQAPRGGACTAYLYRVRGVGTLNSSWAFSLLLFGADPIFASAISGHIFSASRAWRRLH